MAESSFLTYKNKPLVRKGNEIYYGDMTEKYVVRFKILSSKKEGKLDIADKVSVELIKNDTEAPIDERVAKSGERENLFDALDLGLTWLERHLEA